MLLFLLWKYGNISQVDFGVDEKMKEVLDLMDKGQFDECRHLWIHHVMETSGRDELYFSENYWNLWSDSCIFSLACKLFHMKVKDLYGPCTVLGECCPHANSYIDEPDRLASTMHCESYVHACVQNYGCPL